MFTALLIAAASTIGRADDVGFAHFQRSQSLIYITEAVDIFAAHSQQSSRLEYEVRYRWSQQFHPTQREAVLNSIDCPAIRDVVATMGKLTMPQPALIFDGVPPPPPIEDGDYYELKAPSSYGYGDITITSNVRTPLAAWVNKALAALQPCLPPTPHS